MRISIRSSEVAAGPGLAGVLHKPAFQRRAIRAVRDDGSCIRPPAGGSARFLPDGPARAT